jgi:excisionase family DNA binding protein
MAPHESWVGVEDVAAHLRVAQESIDRWIDSKGFPAHRVGRLLRFKLSEVDEWVTASGGDRSGAAPLEKPTARQRAARQSNVRRTSRHGSA